MSKVTDTEKELWTSLPSYYEGILEFRAIVKVEAEKLAALDIGMENAVDQLFIESATWGLSRWEKVFGILIDESKPYDQRRSVLISKVRGAGVTTVALVKEVAQSWYNGEIDVIEGELLVEIKFKSNLGVPPNLGDVEKALRDIIPAHLELHFLFSYLLVRDIHNKLALNELEQQPLSIFAGGGNIG